VDILQRTGIAKLPLHYGKAPHWLVVRMTGLAQEITTIIVDEYGRDEFLRRISDTYWFQALGCVLGYDWHSSGVTTVLTGVLKNAIKPEEHGLVVCGGKGKASMQTQTEIGQAGDKFGFSTDRIEDLRYASRMSAKVDNTAVQAGYALYHHAFVVSEDGKWAVVQQGMSVQDRTARRYHWLSDHVQNFVVEPHDAIVGDVKRNMALDMTAKDSEDCRKVSTDIVKEQPKKLIQLLQSVRPAHQTSLQKWMPEAKSKEYMIEVLSMPCNLNWKVIKRAYEFQPKNYEQLLSVRGVGPATVRGLALVAELVYGASPSWKDPVKYSFAFGGKDGVPFPVDRKAMDESIRILESAVQNAKIGNKEKLRSLQRLRQFVPSNKKT
jgi:hypothetical protein